MPEPQSRRGNVITQADFEAPFETQFIPFGVGGLDLAAATDKVPPGKFIRLTNHVWAPNGQGQLTGRLGQTRFATSGGPTGIHSIIRLDDLQSSATTYAWGISTFLFKGASGTLLSVDSGYSGDPITFVPIRPPLSGNPWVYLADRSRMRKMQFDGTVLPIGLPVPAACNSGLGPELRTNIAVGSTTADIWGNAEGLDFSDPPQIAQTGTNSSSATGTTFTTDPGDLVFQAGNGYWCYWGLARTLNLNIVGGDTATDDDLMHVVVKFKNPALVAEMRLYVVVSSAFGAGVLPGVANDINGNPVGDINQDYYMKSFRPDDFTPMVQAYQSQVQSAEQARINSIRQQHLQNLARLEGIAPAEFLQRIRNAIEEKYPPVRVNDAFVAQRDPSRDQSVAVGASGNQSIEFGSIGIPLRRGDFKRFGNTAGRDWGTVTGLIVYLQALPNAPGSDSTGALNIGVTIDNWWLTGGSGPDVSDPAAQSYDWRATNYDPRTGAESNPTDVMAENLWLDPLRRAVTVAVAPYGDSAMRQRFYRRGGGLTSDWYYVGVNDADGGSFIDEASDLEIAAAGTVEIDHYQPVPTIDDNGNTVLAQPVPILIGPYNGQLLALGDPYRPGFIYASKPGEPDHWPPDLCTEVCPSTEELMNGVMYGGQPFVFSRKAGYPVYSNVSGAAALSSAPSECKHGLAGRWALAVGAGSIWFVSDDNVYRTQGGAEVPVANDLWPLFHAQSSHGYAPIDFTDEVALRLTVYDSELWFGYRDTNGDLQMMILQILTGAWRHYTFGQPVSAVYDDFNQVILGGAESAWAYTHTGTGDDGDDIFGTWQTGAIDFGRNREEKLLGDQFMDVDPAGLTLQFTNTLNNETVNNTAQSIGGFSGRQLVILDSFGTEPQRARNVSSICTWNSETARPTFYQFGTAFTPNPDITINRVTNWDDLGHPDEKYLMGVTLDCDTGGTDRTIIIERDFAGVITTVATLTVNADGRHKLAFSWSAVQANMVRIRPDDDCAPWILYRADWIAQNEPPRIAAWDSYFENAWDQYYTGLDLMCDTGGATKRIVVKVDEVALTNPATGNAYWDISANGRQVVHLTLPTGRGHVFRFYATDTNAGLLYSHRWHLVEEPSEQANWNQPYTILGTQADKYLKALVFEIDTFGQNKTVAVQADGVTVTTLTVNTNGRKVQQVAFAQQLGRVWRFIPTDSNPSRLYTVRPVFDEEPFCFDRWETQYIDHGQIGYHSLIEGMITLKSTAEITLTISTMVNQSTGAIVTDTYTIPSTAGVKTKTFVPFSARKGVLYKYLFTCADPFWLYQEESDVVIQPWQGGDALLRHPFGNSGADLPTRTMLNASLAAARSGGGD
jgi:hypothetical protein